MMPEMTIADCAVPLWDAGCRYRLDITKNLSDSLRHIPFSGIPKGYGTYWYIDRTLKGEDMRSSDRTFHEAAVLLLHQAEVELAPYGYFRPVLRGEQWKWFFVNFDYVEVQIDISCQEFDSKHTAIVAAYLAMKGVEG